MKPYRGDQVTTYEVKRQASPQWAAENKAIEKFIAGLPKGSSVLDVPCGTGRFAPVYTRHGIKAFGIDASEEMAAVATKAGLACRVGDIRDLSPNMAFAVVCFRLANWCSHEELPALISSVCRAAMGPALLSIRCGEPSAPLGRTVIHSKAEVDRLIKLNGRTAIWGEPVNDIPRGAYYIVRLEVKHGD